MNYNHVAFWSASPSQEESRDRITHHNRTKRRDDRQRQQEQRNQDFWTWEEILDGRGPWAKPGECRRPKVQQEKRQQEQRKEEWTSWSWTVMDPGHSRGNIAAQGRAGGSQSGEAAV